MRPTTPVAIDEDLRRWRARFPDATPIAELVPRQPQTIVGVASRIRIVPGRSLTLRLRDGTGEVSVSWQGRSSLPGLALGMALRCTAAVATEADGGLVLRNPAWSPVTDPTD